MLALYKEEIARCSVECCDQLSVAFRLSRCFYFGIIIQSIKKILYKEVTKIYKSKYCMHIPTLYCTTV